jgi:hypothetical protein
MTMIYEHSEVENLQETVATANQGDSAIAFLILLLINGSGDNPFQVD